MNLELKKKFFAQYFGQKVMKKDYQDLKHFYSEPDGFINGMTEYSPLFLELKPLSQISDEDIKQWAYLIFKSEFKIIELYQNASDVWVIFNENKAPFFIQPQDCNAMQIDFLRSKGYAIPFMEYSVDDLVSFGWVRLS